MAKWGEGDPRWIVEERPDATNVNNWHWTEKNASGWSKERIRNLLTEIKLEDDFGYVQVTELTSIEGEAIANNRKAKLIFFFEWLIKGKWSGKLNDGEHEIKGDFEIPNLSEENDPNEIDVLVTYTDNSEHDKNQSIKELFRVKGTKLIQSQLAVYIKELKEEYAKDLVLPTKSSVNKISVDKKSEQVKSTTKINKAPSVSSTQNSNSNELTNLKSLQITEELKCSASDFYNALVKEDLVSRFTQDKATVSSKVGGEFSMFGGNIEGVFIDLIPDKLIKQKWRFKNWPTGHYSNVMFEIEQKSDCIFVKVEQDNIPSYEFEKVRDGWKNYYFESLKRVFGFGSTLY